VKAMDRPVFAFSYQVADARKGNGDGKVQKGEQLTMYVSVKNVGKGKSFDTQANLRNLSGDGLLLHEGRFDISNMQPGEVKKLTFAFDVTPALTEPEAKVELSIADRDLRENVVEKVRMPISVPSPLTTTSGAMKARAGGATLLESADPGARAFGRLGAGTAANATATTGDLTKVTLGDNRFGFVKTAELEPGGTPAGVVAFEETMRRFPPLVEIQPVALAVRDDKVQIKGTATDTEKILDGYVFVGNRKVFYRSNRNGADPKKMTIDTAVPLRPGVNVITVVARENVDTVGRKTLIIRRDGPNGEILQTPKTDEESEAGGGDD